MKGIILLSHGPMAQGLYETTKRFMGEEIPQDDYLCLKADDDLGYFDTKVKELIEKNDSGEGVIIFTDLLGGTPYNRCVQFACDNIDVFAGMNLTIVLEQLGRRLSDDYDFDTLIDVGRNGLTRLSFTASVNDNDDDFLE